MSNHRLDEFVPLARLGWTLIHFVWQGGVVALVVASLLLALRSARAQVRYLVSLGGLALMAAAPVITFCMLKPHAHTEHIAPAETSPAAIQRAQLPPAPVAVVLPAAEQAIPAFTKREARLEFEAQLETLMRWLVAIWLLGVAALSMGQVASYRKIGKLRRQGSIPMDKAWQSTLAKLAQRMGVRQAVGLVESTRVEIPSVVGWLKPLILFPVGLLAGMSPEQIEQILAHELAHVRRHDYLVNLLQTMLETLLFYHPAVWWLNRQVRTLREFCCDDLVVEVMGDAKVYALALAQIDELRSQSMDFSLALTSSGGNLMERIRRILGSKERATGGNRWVAGLAAVVLVGLALTWHATAGLNAAAANETSPVMPIDAGPAAGKKPQGSPNAEALVGWAAAEALGQAGVSGGEGGEVVTVGTIEEFEDYAGRKEPYVIQVKGAILGSQESSVGSNKTIVGLGSDAALIGGIVLRSQKNVIIRNLTFQDGAESGIKMLVGTHHILIDHCNFSGFASDALSIVRGSDFITVSWCHFANQAGTLVIGNKSGDSADSVSLRVTLHHNWFEKAEKNNPQVNVSGMTHVFNNYFQGNRYGIALTSDSTLLVEGNYLQNVRKPVKLPASYGGASSAGIVVRDNICKDCSQPMETMGGTAQPEKIYAYRLDPAEEIPNVVMAHAGVMKSAASSN